MRPWGLAIDTWDQTLVDCFRTVENCRQGALLHNIDVPALLMFPPKRHFMCECRNPL
jgi:hypothetical protein